MAVISPEDTAARLIAGDASAVEDAIGYLENDPWEFRSGYAKATLLRRLKHVELAELDKTRLQTVLLRYVDVGARWDFREACTLARHLDSGSLRAGLRSRLHGTNVSVAARALTMLLRGCATPLSRPETSTAVARCLWSGPLENGGSAFLWEVEFAVFGHPTGDGRSRLSPRDPTSHRARTVPDGCSELFRRSRSEQENEQEKRTPSANLIVAVAGPAPRKL
jgi:hypothetical protein